MWGASSPRSFRHLSPAPVSSHETVMHRMRIVSLLVPAQAIHNTIADLTAHGVVDETHIVGIDPGALAVSGYAQAQGQPPTLPELPAPPQSLCSGKQGQDAANCLKSNIDRLSGKCKDDAREKQQ